MVFDEDAILMSLFSIYEDEEELKQAVLKYCQGGVMEMGRPEVIEATKADQNELDQVRLCPRKHSHRPRVPLTAPSR